MMKIRTTFIYPIFATRNFDYSAIDDDTYNSPVGSGPTKQQAVKDLMEQIEERWGVQDGDSGVE